MKSSGSGVVISPDGYVLTNTHVIENASKITVTLSGGNEYDADVVGVDKTSDLALLKLEGKNFPYADLGDSDDLIIGEWVIALGNPFELFSVSNQPTASVGIISANHMDFGRQNSGTILQNMIQRLRTLINLICQLVPLVQIWASQMFLRCSIFMHNLACQKQRLDL